MFCGLRNFIWLFNQLDGEKTTTEFQVILCYSLTLIQLIHQRATRRLRFRTGVIQDLSTPSESGPSSLHHLLLLRRLIQPARNTSFIRETIRPLLIVPPLLKPDLPVLFIPRVVLHVKELHQVQSRLFLLLRLLAVPGVVLTVIVEQLPVPGTGRRGWITPRLQTI